MMNEQLNISAQVQALINDIENAELNLAELPLSEHPKLPQFNRSIRVLDIDAKSKQQFISFSYEQVLKDKETGEEINISLPAPEWVVYKDTWSYLRDHNNNPVEQPLAEPKDEMFVDKVKVPSYQYMLWLLKNSKVGFTELLASYLDEFVKTHKEELDKLS
ncbi:hypothetical protein BN1195_00297 [Chryseobacterium oranimense G311]|uniref:hypothetical protein n=1 Tax=Chryseobacterium oranimense TaxID=421058 RepID=UPI000533916C|nr:hypothetical protein [Chryseobacterium oranimense]CEJ68015.1 hypothetical protein BN1195_00297 [Chryseobacterium oranimense G311]